MPSLARDLDWIAVMTYDYHGHWDKKTGHVAPFFEHPEDDFYYFNTNFTVHYWLESGAPAGKLVMGMPLYGQSFTLDSAKNNGLNAPARQKGQAGEYTKAAGFLAYYEICEKVKEENWTVVEDEEGRMGPYAYKGTQWVGYDDVKTIRRKSEYIRELGLGGGMVWAMDLDDFSNKCGEGRHPLLSTIKTVLAPPRETLTTTEIPAVIHELPDDTEEVEEVEEYKVVCYFTNWAWYRPGDGKYRPKDIQEELCTHIVYGFAILDPVTLTIRAHDSWADFDNGQSEN